MRLNNQLEAAVARNDINGIETIRAAIRDIFSDGSITISVVIQRTAAIMAAQAGGEVAARTGGEMAARTGGEVAALSIEEREELIALRRLFEQRRTLTLKINLFLERHLYYFQILEM